MGKTKGNTVRLIVPQRHGSGPKKNAAKEKQLFRRELNFQICAAIAVTIYRRGMLQRNEYTDILVMLTQKYKPLYGSFIVSVILEEGEDPDGKHNKNRKKK